MKGCAEVARICPSTCFDVELAGGVLPASWPVCYLHRASCGGAAGSAAGQLKSAGRQHNSGKGCIKG